MGGDIQLIWVRPRRWTDRVRFRVLTDYQYASWTPVIPAGFVTDGSSTPVPFRWLYRPYGRTFPAALVHDYMLAYAVSSRAAAAGMFDAINAEEGVPRWIRWPMYGAIRLYTGIRYGWDA